MTPQDREKLRKKALRATSGPWEVIYRKQIRRPGQASNVAFVRSYADAPFIAAVNPQVVLELLEELERSDAALVDAGHTIAALAAENKRLRTVEHDIERALSEREAVKS